MGDDLGLDEQRLLTITVDINNTSERNEQTAPRGANNKKRFENFSMVQCYQFN